MHLDEITCLLSHRIFLWPCYYIIIAIEVCPHPIQILYLVHYIRDVVLNSLEPQIQPNNNNLNWNSGITVILAPKLLYVLQLCLLLKLYFFKKAVLSNLSPSHLLDYTSTEGDLAPSEPAGVLLCLWLNHLEDTFIYHIQFCLLLCSMYISYTISLAIKGFD